MHCHGGAFRAVCPLRMLLENLSWPEVKRLRPATKIVLLPLGSFEQHGPHLPLTTDTDIVTAVARGVEALRPEKVLCLPTLWPGLSTLHLFFPGTMNVSQMPYIQFVIELCRSVVSLGAKKIFLLNGHGGNDVPVRAALRELKSQFPKPRFVFASYWSLAAKSLKRVRDSGPGGLGHACEMETSIMLHLCPDRVNLDREARWAAARDPYRKADMQFGRPVFFVNEFARSHQERRHRASRPGTGGKRQTLSGWNCERHVTAFVDHFRVGKSEYVDSQLMKITHIETIPVRVPIKPDACHPRRPRLIALRVAVSACEDSYGRRHCRHGRGVVHRKVERRGPGHGAHLIRTYLEPLLRGARPIQSKGCHQSQARLCRELFHQGGRGDGAVGHRGKAAGSRSINCSEARCATSSRPNGPCLGSSPSKPPPQRAMGGGAGVQGDEGQGRHRAGWRRRKGEGGAPGVGTEIKLGVDANGGWSPEVAVTTIERLTSTISRFAEQPVAPEEAAEMAGCAGAFGCR